MEFGRANERNVRVIIKRVQPLPLGKMLGSIYGIMGFIFGLFFAAMSVMFSGLRAAAPGSQAMPWWFGSMFGVGAVIILPILYGAMGFVGGLISAALYNALAKRIGGVVIEAE